MATGLHVWSQTAASNASADSSINWAEGQSPGSVNDSARAMMAREADLYKDNGGLTTGGSATAFTVTTNRAFASAAVMDKSIITIIPNADSGASPTLAVDGLTARAINYSTGVAIPSGALKLGTPYQLLYIHASTEFILLGAIGAFGALVGTSGSFTGTVTVTGSAADFVGGEFISTDAGANPGPLLSLYRNSASPAASDSLAAILWYGQDSAGNKQQYGAQYFSITDTTNGSEDADLIVQSIIGGSLTTILRSSGAQIQVPGSLAATGAVSASNIKMPTVQRLTSGSSNYTPAAGVLYIRVRMGGGGGGGGGASANNGSNGGDTSFGSWTAIHGNGGQANTSGFQATGGTGGTNGTGTLINRVTGGDGNGGASGVGGTGGVNPFGGAGAGSGQAAGGVGKANTGAGGGGGANVGNAGTGGASGEYVEFFVSAPGVTAYAVGAGGNGGAAGGAAGGNGAAGIIVIEEFYV